MNENSKKGIRSYDFTLIFKNGVNIKDCTELLKNLFDRIIGINSIECTWKPISIETDTVLKGSFESYGDRQHKLHRKLSNHECCECPITNASILRTSARKIYR